MFCPKDRLDWFKGSVIQNEKNFDALNMSGKKEGSASSILLTPLLGLKSRKSDRDSSSMATLHCPLPSVSYAPSRSNKNLLGLERESVENVTVSLHQVISSGLSHLVLIKGDLIFSLAQDIRTLVIWIVLQIILMICSLLCVSAVFYFC